MRTERPIARRLHRAGKSYNEINRLLGVPKSTLSVWFRDLRLSKAERQRLMTRVQQHWAESIIRYNKWRAEQAKQKSEEMQAKAAEEIGTLSPRELQLIGTALYWAEGSKRDRWAFRFCNSDPAMVRLAMRFLREICLIPDQRIVATLQLHPHISETEAMRHWVTATGLPKNQFRKPQRVISQSSRRKRPPHRLPYGTFHLRVSDVNVRNRVMGWVAGLQQPFNGSS